MLVEIEETTSILYTTKIEKQNKNTIKTSLGMVQNFKYIGHKSTALRIFIKILQNRL